MIFSHALEAALLYAKTNSPTIIFLEGDLGAGKTHFTNQFADAIGIFGHLPSPTFAFLQEYRCNWEGKKQLIHCDFYRVEPEKADKMLEQITFWDYVDEKNILFIEWPERAINAIKDLPHKTLKITLQDGGERTYEFTE